MRGVPCSYNQLQRYIRELEETAAALDTALDQADTLVAQMDADFSSQKMHAITDMKDQLMPMCRRLSFLLTTLKSEAEAAQRLYDQVDEELASAFR